MAKPIACYPPTGIHVVIVGAGFGGLTTAIECHFKGHKVTVLEQVPEWKNLGDILSLGMYICHSCQINTDLPLLNIKLPMLGES